MQSSPSGNKSTPLCDERNEAGGYRELLRRSLVPRLPPANAGELAVVYDKNEMEASGYAAALADLTGESVHLVPFLFGDTETVRFASDGCMEVAAASTRWEVGSNRMGSASSNCGSEDGSELDEPRWVRVRGAVRYVTDRPWQRVPVDCPTVFLNPVIACLAGGRNKIAAARAYDMYNRELRGTGLAINTPFTLWDVPFCELEACVERLGGFACIKVPYSNAGQGVYTITSAAEFAAFAEDVAGCRYTRFLVQSLISNHEWSSRLDGRCHYHVGTVPDKRGNIYVADLRLMVSGGADGFSVVGMYGRKAPAPLEERLDSASISWNQLGTNLSVALGNGKFASASERLLLMDRRDFDSMGIGLDELIDAMVQTCLATVAIDRMAEHLCPDGVFELERLSAINDDPGLVAEIREQQAAPRGGLPHRAAGYCAH